MDQHLLSDRPGRLPAGTGDPWTHKYRSRSRFGILSTHARRDALPLALAVLALEPPVFQLAVFGLPVISLPVPAPRTPRRLRALLRAVPAPLVAAPTQRKLVAAARALPDPKLVHAVASAAAEVDFENGP